MIQWSKIKDGFVYATKNCIGFQDIRQGGDQSCRVNTDSPVQSMYSKLIVYNQIDGK